MLSCPFGCVAQHVSAAEQMYRLLLCYTSFMTYERGALKDVKSQVYPMFQ
jgi:hypothetical protein